MSVRTINITEATEILHSLQRMDGTKPGFDETERVKAEEFLRGKQLLAKSEFITSSALSQLISGLSITIDSARKLPFEKATKPVSCIGLWRGVGEYTGERSCVGTFSDSIKITLSATAVVTSVEEELLLIKDCRCRKTGPIL